MCTVFAGNCSRGCAKLTILNDSDVIPINSTIIFHATVTINLLPADDSFFVILKDDDHLNSSRVNYITMTDKSITFYIYNIQPEDNGVYQLMHISQRAELLTNRLSFEVSINTITISISPSTSKYYKINT